ncbi:MAG: thioredoxin [Thermoanaerobaculia bacterium]
METKVVRCASCGQANRVPAVGEGKKAVCGRCKEELPAASGDSSHPVEISDATFAATIARGSSVVDFWAPWCGPCRTIAPILEQLASERSDIRFAKLNVDDNKSTAAAFRVQGIPLLVFFKDGVERGRITGAHPRASIESAIRQYLS